MSRISQHFINNIGYLYEEINIQNDDFLNEESEYYDQEAAELVEDIISSISLSMVYEGYSASAVIGFLADSSEDDIIEKYLSYDENTLAESAVSEDYIQEQLEIINYLISERVGSLLGKAAKGISKVFAKRSATALKSAGPLTPQAATRLATKGKPTLATKAKVGLERAIGPKGRKAVQAVKDFGSKAKAALPGIAKGALLAGTGVLAGYTGAKLGSGGKDSSPTGSPSVSPSKTKDDFLKGSALAKLGGREGRIKDGEFRTMAWSPESKKRYAAATKGSAKPTPSSAPSTTAARSSGGSSTAPAAKPSSKPASETKPLTADEKMKQWAKANPKLAAKVKPGESGYEAISQVREKPSSYEKQDQTPTQGPSNAKIDVKSIEADLKREQEKLNKQKEKSTSTTKESYEPYDIILDYLIGRGHADTIEEAHYIMLEMDESAVCTIIEEYNDYVLAEEVSEWVDELLENGYDLSEYTWDDIVEYYVVEAKYGTSKGREKLAKKVRAGKDVGKKGGGFEEIVKKASSKYGKERATKIAAAAMWKNLGK